MRLFATATICLLSILLAADRVCGQEIIDPKEAQKDADFLVQGEFAGEGTWVDGKPSRIGAQVIAQGKGKFRAVIHQGGLPGDGWKRGGARLFMDGQLADGVTKLTGKELPSGEIKGDTLTIQDKDGKTTIKQARAARKSPTLGAKPPKGAVVLFDGSNVDHFPGATLTDMNTLQAGCKLKGNYAVSKIHIELRLSWKPTARGQGRSNSGVFIGGLPEIQVLDSFGLDGKKNECGAFYGRREPDVNMCFPPLVWQTYDVEFTQPASDKNILATVRHNGVVIHKNFDTGKKETPKRGLSFQAHGNRVQYRNIWLVEAK